MKIFTYLMFALLAAACNKPKTAADQSSSDKDVSDKTTKAGQIAVASTNELAGAFPEGLSVTVFPKALDSTPGVAAAGTVAVPIAASLIDVCPPPPQPTTPGCTPPAPGNNQPPQNGTQPPANGAGNGDFNPFAQHPKDGLAEAQKRLNGESECFGGDILNALQHAVNQADACYGFDYGIVSGTAMGDVDPGQVNAKIAAVTDQSIAGVKAALATLVTGAAETKPEACMVKIGRQMIETEAARLNGSLRVFEGMFCQAKKDGLADNLPDIGVSLDLKSVFAHFDNVTVTEATVRRLDDKDSRAVYRTVVAFTPTNGLPTTLTLVHSPSLAGNTEYNGVMLFETQQIDNQSGTTKANVTNIVYEKTGAEEADQHLMMEVRNASFNKAKVTGDYVTATGEVDFNVGADATGSYGPGEANEYVSAIKYFSFDVNPSSLAGVINFWNNPGGNYEEAPRGFTFSSTQNTDGTLSGCAYSGADREGSIRKAVREGRTLKPNGCFTPQLSFGACGNGNDNVGNEIWKQCFKQDADGLYLIDAANTIDTAQGFDEVIAAQTILPVAPSVQSGGLAPIKN